MIEVIEAGPLTTIQDGGRFGHAHLGVSPAGPVDWLSHALANRLVGNAETVAALEFTLHGPTLRCESPVTMAVVGAPSTVDGVPVRAAFRVRAGQAVRIGQCPAVRGYIAVGGGFPGDEVLGSRSTDIMGGLGPRPLRAGDRMSTVDSMELPRQLDPAVLPDRGGIVRVVPGPRDDWFTAASRREFFGKPYTAAPDSDRAGVRLTGPRLVRSRTGELPTEGMATGAVQVPPSGQPIVLLAGHGPTGGYPVIGVVIRADLPTVGQLLPGRGVRFTPVTVEQARAAYRELRKALDHAVR
jgi:biotin-dependent carboxylase-like uncharacterized protein